MSVGARSNSGRPDPSEVVQPDVQNCCCEVDEDVYISGMQHLSYSHVLQLVILLTFSCENPISDRCECSIGLRNAFFLFMCAVL